MAKSRLQMRREAEAAESTTATKTKKKATRKKAATRKAREKAPERKRAVWVIYSGSMKEEGRYTYDQKEAADERLETLLGRGKKLYFMQLVKELITGEGPVESDAAPAEEEAAAVESEDDEELDDDIEATETSSEDADFDADVEGEDDGEDDMMGVDDDE